MTYRFPPPRPFAVSIRCATGDGKIASHIALLPPDEDLDDYAERLQHSVADIQSRRRPGRWHFIYRGVLAGNGYGDPIGPEEAARISQAFTLPYSYSRIRLARLYDDAAFCDSCNEAYCYSHWNVSDTGGGRCPKGHWKSLDPHWSPDD